MSYENLVKHAITLLKSDDAYLIDAAEGVNKDNTIVGSVMSITLKLPRKYTELAVAEALRRIEQD